MLDKSIKEVVEIPGEVNINVRGNSVQVDGPNGKLSKEFDIIGIRIELQGEKIIVRSESSRKEKRAAVGTVISHIKNMIQGVTEGFSSKLKVVYSHFPISINVKGRKVEIENFIGEEESRFADIVGETEVEVNGDEILVEGVDKEGVGQTAANIEQTAQVKNRDPRVFQDGIYIVERP